MKGIGPEDSKRHKPKPLLNHLAFLRTRNQITPDPYIAMHYPAYCTFHNHPSFIDRNGFEKDATVMGTLVFSCNSSSAGISFEDVIEHDTDNTKSTGESNYVPSESDSEI